MTQRPKPDTRAKLYEWADGLWRYSPQPTAPAIYTAGYGSGVWARTLADLFASARMAGESGGVVLDIRYKPYSPNPDWRQEALCERFQGRYEWLGASLGNRNYNKPQDGIHIVDIDSGLARTLFWMETRRWSPILLCACSHKENCHRTVVADALQARGYATREMIWCEGAKAESASGETKR